MAVSKKQLEYAKKWDKENLKRVGVAFRKDEYEALKKYCDSFGFPVSGFIRQVTMKSINYKKDDK